VQRPVFYAIIIIITAYLPIFTLQRVEGRLFHPMAWTVAFALLGAVIFSITIAPVLASLLFRRQARDWQNPAVVWITRRYQHAISWTVRRHWVMVGVAAASLAAMLWLLGDERIGSEFLPHLDEGALWVRGTLAPSAGPTGSVDLANRARILLCSWPEVIQCWSQVGRPDDGTDHTSFFNTEYFVDLKPREQWRPAFHQKKDELIASMSGELSKIPGVIWGFSQPIEDNMEEAVSGVKGQLATKVYGDDLHVLESLADQIAGVLSGVRGITDLGVLQVTGQPNYDFAVDRAAAARYQINVADVQNAINTAVGGNALTQVLQGEARYDLVLRYLPQYRDTKQIIENIRLLAPTGERVSLAQLCKVEERDEGSEI
jgi:heavy metal efflux system protein